MIVIPSEARDLGLLRIELPWARQFLRPMIRIPRRFAPRDDSEKKKAGANAGFLFHLLSR